MKANLVSANKPQRRSTRRVLIGSLVALTSLFAACGGDTTDSSASVETEAPTSNQADGEAPQGQADGTGRDPLGRERGDARDGRDIGTMVPGEDTRERARELLDEIRRRSGDQTRPETELDYLRRLLDRF